MPQFGGAAEKCTVCSKTVYLAEKIVVEDKEDKKTFHKTCLKCTHCKVTLTLGNYASMQGVFYCKPHFKQLFATKGNYDEGFGKDKHTKNWTPQAVSAPASFVPVDKEDGKKDAPVTPSSIANKFGKTTSNTEKCHVCNKTVYVTEKTVIEEKEGKKVFHKTCLKCAHCNVIVTLGNYAAMQGVVYCKPHFKQLFAAKGNYDEGFGKEKASSKWEPQAVVAPATFVPVDKDDAKAAKSTTSDAVANKFNKGTTSSEKCSACGKTVYLTEKIVVEDKEDKQTFHKACLRCKHCQVVLTLGNYASMQGVMYCKPHFKQLFAVKGNYDEGFGKEKLTKKWVDKDGTPQEQADPSEDQREREERERHEEEEREEAERRRRAKEIAEEHEREEREEHERQERKRIQEEAEARDREEAAAREREEEERERREREEEEERERERREQEEAQRHEEEHRHHEDEHHYHHNDEEEHHHEHEEEHHHDHDEEEHHHEAHTHEEDQHHEDEDHPHEEDHHHEHEGHTHEEEEHHHHEEEEQVEVSDE